MNHNDKSHISALKYNGQAICPLPLAANLAQAKIFFNSKTPPGFIITSVGLIENEEAKGWLVQMKLDRTKHLNEMDTKITYDQMNNKLHQTYSSISITRVSKIQLHKSKINWMFECYPRLTSISTIAQEIYAKSISKKSRTKNRTLSDSSIRTANSGKAAFPLCGSNKEGVPTNNNKRALQTDKITVVMSDSKPTILFKDVDENCKPRYLMYGKENVTKSVTGKYRLSRKLLNILKQMLSCSGSVCRKQIRKECTALVKVDKSTKQSRPPPLLKVCKTTSTCIPPPSSYLSNIMKSKLHDANTFKAASRFLALAQANDELKDVSGKPYELNIRPRIDYLSVSRLELKFRLRSAGLPTDSSLYQLFQDFCTDLGISEVPVLLMDEYENLRSVGVNYDNPIDSILDA